VALIPAWGIPVVAAAFWAGILMEGAGAVRPAMGTAGALLAAGLTAIAVGIMLLDHCAGRSDEVHGLPAWSTWIRATVAWLVVVSGFAALGAGWAAVRETRLRASPLAAMAGHAVDLVGAVGQPPTAGQFGWNASMSATQVSWRGSSEGLRLSDSVWVEGHGRPPSLRPGDRVSAEGSLSVPNGPFGAWLLQRGYAAVLSTDHIEKIGPPGSLIRRGAEAVRDFFARSVRRVFPERDAGLMMGLTLGDTSRLDPGIEEDFRATGLSHLTAVSGENLAMFLAPIMGLLGVLGLGRAARFAGGGCAVVFFVLLTGAEPSVLRAAVMAGLTLLGVFLGRPRSPPVVLGAAVLVLLVVNPTLVHSIGFQLSVAATAGMALLAEPLSRRMGFLPSSLALAAGTTASAQIGVAPVLLYHFGLVPLISLPANLLAFPAVAPSMLLGLLAAALGFPIRPLGGGIAVLARIPLRYLIGLAHRLAQSPLPAVTSSVRRATELAVGFALVLAAAWWLRTGAPMPRRAVAAAVIVLPVFVWAGALRAGPPAELTVTFFSVGQGDGAVLRSPAGATVVIDGGPDPELMARKLASLGVRRVDVLVATHLHQDHVAGLPVVLVRFPVGLVLDPGCRGDAPAYSDFLRAVGQAGVPFRHPRPGTVVMAGDIRLEVLGPLHCFHGTDSDPNNDSLVLRAVSGGASILFSGDAEQPAQQQLLDQEATGLTAQVFKVPHHGGATSLETFFLAVHARIAVVSVGPNYYGHPVPEILAELASDGMRVFRTDHDGDVTVRFRGGEVTVQTGG
jgi:competence protein ComEC